MMPTRPFVHLHCHSEYSLLDGASPISRLVARTVEHGMNALALTDHGNLHGALEFYQAARQAGINPIIGYEAYVAPASRLDKSAGQESSYHLTLLCQNRTGFQNLIKLASAAYLDGFYFKPRIDRQLLEAHHEGLICLSGCLSSQLSQAILRGGRDDQWAEAEEIAMWFARLFGERYFIEIMNNGVPAQQLCLEASVDIAQRLGLPMVATSDCHYIDRSDADVQDVMLCINTLRMRSDTNRLKMDGDQFYLRSPDEMYARFPGLEDAVARSQQIADGIDIQLELGRRHFPVFDLPPTVTAESYLRELCLAGLHERYAGNSELRPNGELALVVMDRLNRELDVINKLGFSNYFLIVWDFVREARAQRIPVTARGSSVGALVAYALYLSHVCPIQYDLLFERFLDESRREAPDIDIDFCQRRRGELIAYVRRKYGEDNVVQIGTFITMAARKAIGDVGRVLGMPLAKVSQLTSLVPTRLAITIDEALADSAELRQIYEEDESARQVIDYARKLEGLARNVSTHAAALVISDRPLTEYVPLGRATNKPDLITQWSMEDVEAAGLMKMDLLGLRNLTLLADAVQLIHQTTGRQLDLHAIPLDDPATYQLLARGETKGVFQLESGGIRDLLQQLKPDQFRDLIATIALYRPGPLEGGLVQQYIDVKHGRREAEYSHPIVREILEETHGVMVYQEQVMRILNRLGNIPLANAYTCIKAISKKKESIIAENCDKFIDGAMSHGMTRRAARDLWDLILKFAGYGFNKSHSTAYALIAYQTAYLKTHYPVEFMAALLTNDIAGRNYSTKDALVEHLDDCRRMSITVRPPTIDDSDVGFTIKDNEIVFALSAIKGVGSSADAIVAERRRTGPFRDLFDFCQRLEVAACSRSAIEALIKAGAMGGWGARRSQLMASLDRAMQSSAAALADRRRGQKSLFGSEDIDDAPDARLAGLVDVPEFEARQLQVFEKEVLGFYWSSHPLAQYADKLRLFTTTTTEQLEGLADRQPVALGGVISSIKLTSVKRVRDATAGTRYAMFDLEDTEGAVRCIIWPTEYAQQSQYVQAESIVVVRGVVDRRGADSVNLIVNELIPLAELDQRCTRRIHITIDQTRHGSEALPRLAELLRRYPGSTHVDLTLRLADGDVVHAQTPSLRVDWQPALQQQLDELLSTGFVRPVIGPIAPAASNGRRDRPRKPVSQV